MKSFLVRFFSFFGWIKISSPPKWVIHKTEGYDAYFCNKYKQLPYDKIKVFKGKKFLYKVIYQTIEQGKIDYMYYVKRRS